MPAGHKSGNSLPGVLRTPDSGLLAPGLEQDLPGGKVG